MTWRCFDSHKVNDAIMNSVSLVDHHMCICNTVLAGEVLEKNTFAWLSSLCIVYDSAGLCSSIKTDYIVRAPLNKAELGKQREWRRLLRCNWEGMKGGLRVFTTLNCILLSHLKTTGHLHNDITCNISLNWFYCSSVLFVYMLLHSMTLWWGE